MIFGTVVKNYKIHPTLLACSPNFTKLSTLSAPNNAATSWVVAARTVGSSTVQPAKAASFWRASVNFAGSSRAVADTYEAAAAGPKQTVLMVDNIEGMAPTVRRTYPAVEAVGKLEPRNSRADRKS